LPVYYQRVVRVATPWLLILLTLCIFLHFLRK
jgi:hypothetical protein